MADKIPTGVAKLDKALGGGLTPGLIILVIGEPGSGKTTLLRKFLCDGVESGNDSIYLLTNRSLDRVLTNLSRAGCDYADSDKMKFMLYSGVVSQRVKSLVGNYEDLIDIAYNCERLVSNFEPGKARMAIDDISYLFLMNNKDIVFKFLQRITQILREKDVTCLVEVQKGMLDPQIVTALESLTDGTIEMKRDGEKKSIRVSRMEDNGVAADWISFEMSPGSGAAINAEKTLDDWEKVLFEGGPDYGENKVRVLLRDIREKGKAAPKKGKFNILN